MVSVNNSRRSISQLQIVLTTLLNIVARTYKLGQDQDFEHIISRIDLFSFPKYFNILSTWVVRVILLSFPFLSDLLLQFDLPELRIGLSNPYYDEIQFIDS